MEAAIDFPEEEIDFLADDYIADTLHQLIAQVESCCTAPIPVACCATV